MLEELSKQIKAQLYTKANSPLFGAFIFSWAAWNFRTIVVVFSGADLDTKLVNLDILYPSTLEYLTRGLAYPILSAATFITLYPYPARLAYWHWQKQHSKIKKIQQAIEDETPATQEEINALRKTSLEQQISLQNQIRNLSDTNRELSAREETLIGELELARNNLSDSKAQIELLQQSKIILEKSITESESRHKKQGLPKAEYNNNALEMLAEQNPEGNALIKFISRLEAPESTSQNKELARKFRESLGQYSLNWDMALILMALVMKDGSNLVSSLQQFLNNSFSKVELEAFIEALKDQRLVFVSGDGSHVQLSSDGKRFALESGLTKIIKELYKK